MVAHPLLSTYRPTWELYILMLYGLWPEEAVYLYPVRVPHPQTLDAVSPRLVGNFCNEKCIDFDMPRAFETTSNIHFCDQTTWSKIYKYTRGEVWCKRLSGCTHSSVCPISEPHNPRVRLDTKYTPPTPCGSKNACNMNRLKIVVQMLSYFCDKTPLPERRGNALSLPAHYM